MSITIISREQAGLKPPRSRSTCAWDGKTLWVHHSDGATPGATLASTLAVVRNIQAFHMGPSRGWADIGYAYLVDPAGRIIEGRGPQVWAAHAPGRNDEPSVCLLGDYEQKAPSDAAIAAVWALADHFGLTDLNGHREAIATTCPGDEAMRALVNAPRPSAPKVDAGALPYGGTLRLSLQTAAERRAGKNGRTYAGWDESRGPLVWIRKNRLAPTTNCAISWRGNVWRGPSDVAAVAATLANRYGL